MIEEWKDIEGYEGLYQVSNLGNVRSLWFEKERLLKLYKDMKGYYRITLCKNGRQQNRSVHRLVAEAFIPNIDNKPSIDHINTIKNDNRVENLRWVTNKENSNNPLTKEKQIKSKISKPILQLDKNMELVKKWNGVREIERELNYPHNNISKCCKNQYGFKSAYGYKWGFEEDYEQIPFKVFDLKIYKKVS